MTTRPDRTLTDEEARALWERAARLQAEAATRRLPAEGDADADVGPSTEGGLRLEVVRRAAMEAGIDPAFVDDALVELDESGPTRRVDRWADRYLGEDTPVARVTRIVDAPLAEAYLALQRVLPRSPFHFVLKRVDGPDPRRGGVLVFEVPYMPDGTNGLHMSGPAVDIRHYADFRELRVRMRTVAPAGEAGREGGGEAGRSERTEIEVTASRTHARRVSFWVGQSIGGFVGIVNAFWSGLLTAALLGVGGPIGALAILSVGGAVGAGSVVGTGHVWRYVYRWGQRKGEAAMERMLDAIDLDLRTGGAFSAGSQAQKKLSDAGDDAFGLGGLPGG